MTQLPYGGIGGAAWKDGEGRWRCSRFWRRGVRALPPDERFDPLDSGELPWMSANADGSVAYVPALSGALRLGWGGEDDGSLKVWAGGRESVWDGVTGLPPCDYGEGEAGYYGYDVPHAEPRGFCG